MLGKARYSTLFARRRPAYQTLLMLAYVTGSTAGKDMASQRTFPLRHGATLVIKQGDITKENVEAIVNAANQRMLGGGGVDGAIHRAAGPQLVRACAAVPETQRGVRCPTGQARITPGFNLPALYVIHTVGPVYDNAEQAAPLLASAYRKSMELAIARGLVSISFPAISTGVYGYPYEEAAEVALTAVEGSLDTAGPNCPVKEVRFVLFGQQLYDVFVREAQRRASTTTSSSPPTAVESGNGAAPEAAPEAAPGSSPQQCEEL